MHYPRPVTEGEAGCDAVFKVFGTYGGTCVKTFKEATRVGSHQSCLVISRADVKATEHVQVRLWSVDGDGRVSLPLVEHVCSCRQLGVELWSARWSTAYMLVDERALRDLASAFSDHLPLISITTYSSRAKVSGRAANDPGFVKVSQNSILRISINIHCTAGELYS